MYSYPPRNAALQPIPAYTGNERSTYGTNYGHARHYSPTPDRSSSEVMDEADSSYVESSEAESSYQVTTRVESNIAEEVKVEDGESEHLKILPRSYCPFNRSTVEYEMYDSKGFPVQGELYAAFTSKFLIDTKACEPHYIAYRRNYFGVSVNYKLLLWQNPSQKTLFIYVNGVATAVKQLVVRIRAVKDDEDGEEVEIVRHNAKREVIHDPNDQPLEKTMQPYMHGISHVFDASTRYGEKDKVKIPTNHTFPRLQFRKATENNGHRRKDQRYHCIIVELCAAIDHLPGEERLVAVSRTISGKIVVHGRGPSSHEAPDPNNRRRKPRKLRSAPCKHAAAKPTGMIKRSGPSKNNMRLVEATATAVDVRPKRRCFSTGLLRTTGLGRTITANARSDDISPLMVPAHEIPQAKILPDPTR